MFYSQFILAKKGPLGTIWIAAHLERKLRKNQVTETNISVSVDSILFPEVPIALRLSGHLLLGVVRIYSRKVNYLFHDCSEALVKIKQAFHSGAVDLPPESATAPFHSITLPETFDLDDLELLPDREALFLANSSIDHHVTSREQITLQDPVEDNAYLSSQFGLDERFPDGDNPRLGLDFDEDVIFVKPQAEEEAQEDSAVLEEDVLPSIQIDDQMEQMDAYDVPEKFTPGYAPDVMDLDERQLDEPSSVQMDVDDQIEPPTDANAFDMNAAPETDVSKARETEAEQLASTEYNRETATEVVDGVELTNSKAPSEEMLEVQTPPATAAALPASAPTVVEEAPADVMESAADTSEPKISTAGVEEDALADGVAEAEPPPEGAILAEEAVQGEVHDKETMDIDVPAVEMKTSQIEGETQTNEKEQLTEDFPDIEKVRSAVDARDLEPNVLELTDAFVLEKAPVEKVGDENAQVALEEDRLKSQDVEETPNLKQDPSSSILRASPPSTLNLPDFADVPGDDDMLATILGRRTPALRVAPTPSDLPPAKRQKPGPKPGSKKRKIQYDESTVLHGDTMRQQLADTTDSQRVRKRAPCTEHEIWGMEKEAQGQQMFDEPLIQGICDSIREIYHCIYGVGDAKLPLASVESDEVVETKDARQLENSNPDIEAGPNVKIDKHQLDLQETNEALSLEEENFDELDIYDIQRLGEEALGEPELLERDLDSEVKISEVEVSVAEPNLSTDTGLGLDEQGKETQASAKVDDIHEEQANTLVVEAQECQASELEEAQVSVEADIPVENEVDTAVPQPHTEDVQAAEIVEIANNETDLKDEQFEVNEEVGAKEVEAGDAQMDTESLMEADEIPVESEKAEVDHRGENVIESGAGDEYTGGEQSPKDEASVAVNDDTTVQMVNPVHGEEPLVDPSADGEHPMEALGFLTDAKDADGEACDDADDYDAGYAEEQVQDNSGWSVRTRAVCQYLRVTFETMETSRKEKQGAKLGLERLLQGKTRREAARMFFETLVLKTKDYINVEQGAAFDNIYIAPRAKLMKADL